MQFIVVVGQITLFHVSLLGSVISSSASYFLHSFILYKMFICEENQ